MEDIRLLNNEELENMKRLNNKKNTIRDKKYLLDMTLEKLRKAN